MLDSLNIVDAIVCLEQLLYFVHHENKFLHCRVVSSRVWAQSVKRGCEREILLLLPFQILLWTKKVSSYSPEGIFWPNVALSLVFICRAEGNSRSLRSEIQLIFGWDCRDIPRICWKLNTPFVRKTYEKALSNLLYDCSSFQTPREFLFARSPGTLGAHPPWTILSSLFWYFYQKTRSTSSSCPSFHLDRGLYWTFLACCRLCSTRFAVLVIFFWKLYSCTFYSAGGFQRHYCWLSCQSRIFPFCFTFMNFFKIWGFRALLQ